MDGRDSSLPLSSTTVVNRHGPLGDEDGYLSVTAALGKEAALHFQSRKFIECLDVLNQLLQKKDDDPKVLHNIAILESFRDGCSKPKKFLEVLNNVKRQSEELARASGEHAEAVSNIGNKAVLGYKGSATMVHQFSAANNASIIYRDEFDTSVATYNIAVIWFHLHEYEKALLVLEPIYQNLAPVDETTALHITLLLMDVVLACHNASKSADVFNCLERAFGVGCVVSQCDNGNKAQQPSANLDSKSSSAPSSAADASNLDSAASINTSENSLTRTLSDETLEYETMLSTLDISGQNLARSAGLSNSKDFSRTPVDRSIPTVDLKLKLQLYRVQFLLLTRNLKLAKREVKHALNIVRGRDSSVALLLKSQLEYARGNHGKAIKLLMASNNPTEPGFSSIFNNNLGCIYYRLGKYHTSSVFFSKALTAGSSLRKDKPLKLLTFSQDKSLLITYNCGVQYLACGKPVLAARCFQKASLVFYNRPLLWLRLAECCLMALEKRLLRVDGDPSDRSEVRVHVIGKGKWRQLVMEDGISRNRKVDPMRRDDGFMDNDGQPKLSMSLARQCLFNAMHLLNCLESEYLKSGLPPNFLEENESSEAESSKNSSHKNLSSVDSKASSLSVGISQANANGDAKEPKGGTNQEIIQSSLTYYEDICRRENRMIKQALLANLAFVELELENPLKALSTARSLLKLPECSRMYIFLGHVYAAEALCLLNKPREAADLLSIYLFGGNNVEFPFSREDCEQRRVHKTVDCEELGGGPVASKDSGPQDSQRIVFLTPEEARGTLFANLATLSAVQGELEKAYQFVTQALSIIPSSPEATMTAVYVCLMLGKSHEALTKLKQCSRVWFLPSSLKLNNSS